MQWEKDTKNVVKNTLAIFYTGETTKCPRHVSLQEDRKEDTKTREGSFYMSCARAI